MRAVISWVFVYTSVCLMLIEAPQLKAFVSKFRDLKTILMPFQNWQPHLFYYSSFDVTCSLCVSVDVFKKKESV